MIRRTLKEIEEMVKGTELQSKYENLIIEGVSTDSRKIKKNQLFIPLIGENFNGHDFIQEAIKKGAIATLWTKNKPVLQINFPFILVEDTLTALQQLAKKYREQLDIKIIGITGSNGKTSTKDILDGLLSTRYKTQKTQGNFNNHIGVPLSILDLREDTEIAVIEMGTSDFGEIQLLTSIVKPHVAIITNIGEAHLQWFKTEKNVAKEKLEILKGLDPNGLFLYWGDDLILKEEVAKLNITQDILTYGTGKDNDYQCSLVKIDDKGISFKLKSPIEKDFFLPMFGKHNMYNATAAILVARYFHIPFESMQEGLNSINKTGGRNELIFAKGFAILNDSYKSNPSSLLAALDTLYSMEEFDQKIVVLGDMQGLGEKEISMHEEIGLKIDPKQVEYIFTIGPISKYLAQAAKTNFNKDKVISCDSNEELIENIKEKIKPNSIILVKASRAFELENVVEKLQSEIII